MTKTTISLFFLSLIIVLSCKKKSEENILGLDVQPENDLVGVTITDTSSLFMHTQRIDSVKSFMDQYKYLGSTQDPIFGRTDAGIYTNYSIANNEVNKTFGVNPKIDSAEIILRVVGQTLGDTITPLQYDVYEITEKIDPTKTYYTNNSIPKSSSKISTLVGKIMNRDGAYCLVLRLDTTFAQSILTNTANLTNNTTFQNVNKGFYITTTNTALNSPGLGAIRRFDLDDGVSGVKLYYKNTISVNLNYLFTFKGIDALRFNHIDHNYIPGNLYDQIYGADTSKGNANVYLNCFGGTRIKLYLPFLKNFSDSESVSINRAELIIKIDDNTSQYNPNYDYPSTLALIACGADGTEELVYDQVEVTDFVKYGGGYDGAGKSYRFNIARQVQKILTNKISNYGFYLVNAESVKNLVIRRDNRLQRVVFGGKTNVNYKPTFTITYIKYPFDK